ncbi:sulfotransferase 1C4-like [Lingula anatina]|uniref:Sulfotransferase 1C4-like n=1 Tax=Lingula anatina TaxID=7574 RepID=A0A1S3IS19_LINAN|nr:sulfotransferase 1C4-like [Lingula anatina]|eukprot:XP_013400868.1 sulfotransferase 1C4-like [Lingula anatina]
MDMVQMLINCDFSELERNTNFKFRVDALELDFAPAYNGTTYHKLLDTVRKPRQLRTHLAYDFLPLHMFHTKARFIHITRNPKDVLVSLFHFYRSNKDLLGQWPGTWAEYFDMFLNKELVYGDWFDHTRGFWERRHNSRMLTLRYEEMLSNPCETVQNLAEFLEIPKSDEDIAKIVELTHFNIIREDPTTNFHRSFHQEHPFCRKGQVGDWKNIFSAEQSEILDRLCAEKIEPLGLKFKFE